VRCCSIRRRPCGRRCWSSVKCEVTFEERVTGKCCITRIILLFRNQYELSTSGRVFFEEQDPALDRAGAGLLHRGWWRRYGELLRGRCLAYGETGTRGRAGLKTRRLQKKDSMARVSPEELLARLEKGKIIPAILLLGRAVSSRCRAALN